MNAVEIVAEAKRRVQRSAPWLTDEQWAQWLLAVAARGGTVALTSDGAVATYPRADAPQVNVASDQGLP